MRDKTYITSPDHGMTDTSTIKHFKIICEKEEDAGTHMIQHFCLWGDDTMLITFTAPRHDVETFYPDEFYEGFSKSLRNGHPYISHWELKEIAEASTNT